MKLLEKTENKIIIQSTSEETQLLRALLMSGGWFVMLGDVKASKEELDELGEHITNYYKKDVSRNQGSQISLTGRQLLIIKDAAAEALRDVASFEFTMRHPGTEEEAAQLLIDLKRIQDEARNYGN